MTKVFHIRRFATLILAASGLAGSLGKGQDADSAAAEGAPASAEPAAGASGGPVEVATWGRLESGEEVRSFVIRNASGLRAEIVEYGALLNRLELPAGDGGSLEAILSHPDLEAALSGGLFGSVVGRFANRIDGGGFEIDGRRYDLESVNERSGVHIHGGRTGFHRRVWHGKASPEGDAVTMSYVSADGEEGYPGRVEAAVTYRLTPENVLRIEYAGTTDAPTHLNLTNHAYFNLASGGDVSEHLLALDAPQVLALDERKIPTGELLPTAGTLFDFREAARLGERLEAMPGGGYDHCFVLSETPGPEGFAAGSDPPAGDPSLRRAARLRLPGAPWALEVATSKPGVQIYTANHFSGEGGAGAYPKWAGIAFETQYYPDAPNRPAFPSSLLRPGDRYEHATEFRFFRESE